MPCSTFVLLTSRRIMKSAKRSVRRHNPLQENGLARSEQFQELTKVLKKESINLIDEMKREHVPIFYDWINSKLLCIDETIKLANKKPILSLNELAESLDQKIETEARKLNSAMEFSSMEAICNSLSALEWTRNIVRAINQRYRLT
jgi:hypothetical protein